MDKCTEKENVLRLQFLFTFKMRNANKKSTETINYPLHRMLNIRLHNFIASIPVFVSYFKNLTHQTTFVLYDQKMKEGSKLDSEVAFRNFEIEHHIRYVCSTIFMRLLNKDRSARRYSKLNLMCCSCGSN